MIDEAKVLLIRWSGVRSSYGPPRKSRRMA